MNITHEIAITLIKLDEFACNERVKQMAISYLDEVEKTRYFGNSHSRTANSFLAGRWLLKNQLAQYLSIDPKRIFFKYSENGKPFLRDQAGLCFSLSHNMEYVACAISTNNIGIDVEISNRGATTAARFARMLNPELAKLVSKHITFNDKTHDGLPQLEINTAFWACLEAKVKANDSSIFTVRSKFLSGASYDSNNNTHELSLENEASYCVYRLGRSVLALHYPNKCDVEGDKKPINITEILLGSSKLARPKTKALSLPVILRIN